VIKIKKDLDPMNPRIHHDNLGTMACWHHRYKLGDIQPALSKEEYRKQIIPDRATTLSLYLLDHSGITISTAPFEDHWDSGWIGYIWAQGDVKDILRAEVEYYDTYLRGEVWGVVIEDACETCGQPTEVVDSCWGFIGDSLEETGILEHNFADEEEVRRAWKKRG